MLQYEFHNQLSPATLPNEMNYCQLDSIFGPCFVAWNEHKVYAVIFAATEMDAKIEFINMFCSTIFTLNNGNAQLLLEKIKSGQYVFQVFSSDFAHQVLKSLLDVQNAHTATYKQIAETITASKAFRAVGSAVAKNRLAWFVPCHRIVRSDGETGDYRWGKELKNKMLAWEKNHPNSNYFDIFL